MLTPKERKTIKKMEIRDLMEVYPGLLTDKEKVILKMFVKPGVTGSAVARKFNITRQAVHDHVKRALYRMEKCEASVRFLRKKNKRTKQIETMEKIVESLSQTCPEAEEEIKKLKKCLYILKRNN